MSAADVANPWRGEAAFGAWRLRPSFAALVAAEDELGPLLAVVERAAAGQLRLGEIAALFWHCLEHRDGVTREALGEELTRAGLAAVAVPLRVLLRQILQGGG